MILKKSLDSKLGEEIPEINTILFRISGPHNPNINIIKFGTKVNPQDLLHELERKLQMLDSYPPTFGDESNVNLWYEKQVARIEAAKSEYQARITLAEEEGELDSSEVGRALLMADNLGPFYKIRRDLDDKYRTALLRVDKSKKNTLILEPTSPKENLGKYQI